MRLTRQVAAALGEEARVAFRWEDAARAGPAGAFDAVVCNPPFHAGGGGRAADPALGLAFLEAGARMLAPGGALWLVANRNLPYERRLGELFGEVEEVGGTGVYKLIRAARPRRGRGRGA